MFKLSMEQITHMWQEAQDQAVTGLPAPVFFANAIVALAARATPASAVPMPAILALAQIGEALGTDEDEGGPAPILEAIAAMKWRERVVSDLMRDWKTGARTGDDVCVELFRHFSSTPVHGADPAPSPASDVSAPSPSSVGDAIRALPLPEDKFCSWMLDGKVVNAFSHGVGDPAKWDRDGYFAAKGYSRAPLYTGAQVSALLSEAAALAEQVQGQQVPEGWKLVPVEPTDAMKWEAEEIEVGNALWDGSQSTCSSSEAEKIYKAMLAAAPSTEDGQKSEGA